jgi:hypothetical protein
MRILLIHPDDSDSGPWQRERWDMVVDLGKAGKFTLGRWSEKFRCPVKCLPPVTSVDLKHIREALFSGLGSMADSHRLDWWELISIRFIEPLEKLISLQKLAAQVEAKDELFLSCSGFHARAFEFMLGRKVHSFFNVEGFSVPRQLRRAASIISKFRVSQLVQILGDKYDAGYRVRRLFTRRLKSCGAPVVLLPSAYVNVSRTGLAYASALPHRDFLLVATRQSGWLSGPPKNLRMERLASYAPGKCREDEYDSLLHRWRELENDFCGHQELSILRALGAFDSVPALLREGLAIRDAWLHVFDAERVTAVLCGDDSNPYTHIPLLIAKERGLPAIACHHGALDGRHLVKRSHADTILAKGRMEWDYLVNTCKVSCEKVEICAPPLTQALAPCAQERKGSIVFFSEPYETAGGRCREFYREVLPRLADVAAATGRELVIKLHPQESLRQRRRLAKAVLTQRQWKSMRIVEGPLDETLLAQTWFAATILSTTAVDCAVRGIPVFLCAWLDHSNYGYVEQFIKFGAAERLRHPDEISAIPGMLEKFSRRDTRYLLDTATPDRLEELLGNPQLLKTAAAV